MLRCRPDGKAAPNSTLAIIRQTSPDTKIRIRMLSSFLRAGMVVSLAKLMPLGNQVYAWTLPFATPNLFGLSPDVKNSPHAACLAGPAAGNRYFRRHRPAAGSAAAAPEIRPGASSSSAAVFLWAG